jgi:hypothetical protein
VGGDEFGETLTWARAIQAAIQANHLRGRPRVDVIPVNEGKPREKEARKPAL